jgi:hypothetical protein
MIQREEATVVVEVAMVEAVALAVEAALAAVALEAAAGKLAPHCALAAVIAGTRLLHAILAD